MKEIKAYVRVHMVDKVIRGLEEAGFTDMTVIDVRAPAFGLHVTNHGRLLCTGGNDPTE